jgi:allophanate hydrolase subunit 2
VGASAAVQPSEPGCPGALQVPPGGRPIVLMADAPTVGGYPKPAVVCAADLGRLAQRPPGAEVRFARVTVPEAQRLYRRARIRVDTLQRLLRRA